MPIEPIRPPGSAHTLIFNGDILPGTPGVGQNCVLNTSDGMVYMLLADSTNVNNLEARLPPNVYDDSSPRTGPIRPTGDQTWVHNTFVFITAMNQDADGNLSWVGKDEDVATEVEVVDASTVSGFGASFVGIPCIKLRMTFAAFAGVPRDTHVDIRVVVNHTTVR